MPSERLLNCDECPPDTELAAFAAGKVAASTLEVIGLHLSACGRCAAALGTGGASDDSMAARLRRVAMTPTGEAFAADPEYQRMIEGANRLAFADAGEHRAASRPISALLSGRLGMYEVGELLGRGGMGVVYRARHVRLKKWVAIKILSRSRAGDPDALKRFELEAEALGQLDHSNIVQATDAGEAGGISFLVMELIDGPDLARLLRQRGPLTVTDACEVVRQAALGLQFAHERGLVHRDVKPSNLLLSATGVVKVLDLGLACLGTHSDSSVALSGSGLVVGTADYMAPEQWTVGQTVDTRADVYGLGCTLYALLTGRPPFGDPQFASVFQKMAAHAEARVTPLRDVRSDVPADLVLVLDRLLAKSPADRYHTPGEAAKALEPFCRGADLAALARGVTPLASAGALPPDGSTGELNHGRITSSSQVALPTGRAFRWSRSFRVAVIFAAVALSLGAVGWAIHALVKPPDQAQTPADGKLEHRLAAEQTRSLEPGSWQNLLERPPRQLFWWNPSGQSHWNFEPKAQKVRMQVVDRSLLTLGQTEAPVFTIQLGIRQERWTGGIGLFFGGRIDPDTNVIRYQTIELRPGGGQRPLRLHRSLGTIQPRPGFVPLFTDNGIASSPLRLPPAAREHILEIAVTRRGLERVAWDGTPYSELTESAVPLPHGMTYQGQFGVYCLTASGQVSQARFLPGE